MTKAVNLIPAHRLAAHQRRVWRGRTAVTCTGYACVVAAVTVGARTVVGRDDAALPGLLDQAAADVTLTTETLAKVKGELDSADSLLRSSRAIAEQPDWSTLLALLAAKAGDEVVLKELTVKPQDPPAAAAAKPAARAAGGKPAGPPADPGVVVTIAGAGQSQAAASQFALRLEATNLFARVALLDTNREGFADLPLVAFRVECSLGGGGNGGGGGGKNSGPGPTTPAAGRGPAAGRAVATGGEP